MDSHRGDDSIYFFAANLGRTEKISVVDSASTPRDADAGPMSPGRWLLHISDISDDGEKVWVRMSPHANPAAAVKDVPSFPMQTAGVVAIEVNVRKGYNDQVAAIVGTGTATLFMTQISREL